MDATKFRRDILTMKNKRRRDKIHKEKQGEQDANNFKRERVLDFQASEHRHGRKVMK